MTPFKLPLRIGTRRSPLARAQAEIVSGLLRTKHEILRQNGALELVFIQTTGDRVQDRPLSAIGGKGLFSKTIEEERLLDVFGERIRALVESPEGWIYLSTDSGKILSLKPVKNKQ